MTSKSSDSAQGKEEYFIDWLVDYWDENGKCRLKVRLYELVNLDETWELIERFSWSSVMRNLKLRRMVDWPSSEVWTKP